MVHELHNVPTKPLPRRTCNIQGNLARPDFNVVHGPGYQNPMVIKYSYGKHCAGHSAGADLEASGDKTQLQIYACPDRTDCSNVNGDAILMAGYYCHPCIPNPCSYKSSACIDSLPYQCRSGFGCPSSPQSAVARPFCDPHSTTTTTTSTTASSTVAAPVVFTGTLRLKMRASSKVRYGPTRDLIETCVKTSLASEFHISEGSVTVAASPSRRLQASMSEP